MGVDIGDPSQARNRTAEAFGAMLDAASSGPKEVCGVSSWGRKCTQRSRGFAMQKHFYGDAGFGRMEHQVARIFERGAAQQCDVGDAKPRVQQAQNQGAGAVPNVGSILAPHTADLVTSQQQPADLRMRQRQCG